MMSKTQWFVLLCMYVVYLLLGATVFHEVEKREEYKVILENKKERIEIEELLVEHYVPNEEHTQEEMFDKLTSYCGKPLNANMSGIEQHIKWDYYHSLFFVITVVSTIGYGNLAPTTTFTRIFMIFYGIIGIPINGIVIITLGDFFGKSFLKLYDRWKTLRVQHALATLGLVGQVILYLIPGFTFFIFLPSIIIMFYEGWDYDVAVAYAFVTLTTIGFGDYVAGTKENGLGSALFTFYQIFLLVWIISGLGYIFMVLGFVTRGMRSKKMHAIEHKIAHNLKKTNHKIREELRSVLNEYLLMRVKRVYREKFVYVPTKRQRSYSCPNLTMYSSFESPTLTRKRAISTNVSLTPPDIVRIQSDSDLQRIDKEQTFKPSLAIVEPSQLLMRVVNALGHYESLSLSTSSSSSGSSSKSGSKGQGIDMFPSSEILASEKANSNWSMGSKKITNLPPRLTRPRAASECNHPLSDSFRCKNNDMTWYGPPATKRLQELREKALCDKYRCKTLPASSPPVQTPTFFSKLRNTFKTTKDDKTKNFDVEKQDHSLPNQPNEYSSRSSSFTMIDKNQVLEETSIADFLRALTAISDESSYQCKRKLGTASLSPPEPPVIKTRHVPIKPVCMPRRTSLIPPTTVHAVHPRRFSLTPIPSTSDFSLPPPQPPPYSQVFSTESNISRISRNPRFSLSISNSSPVQRHALRFKQSMSQEDAKNSNDNSSNT